VRVLHSRRLPGEGEEDVMDDPARYEVLKRWGQSLALRQQERRLAKRDKPYRPTSTWAGSLGYRCERRLTYERVIPWARGPLSAELASIFEEGDLHARDVQRELAELGVRVTLQESPFREDRLEISGKIDGAAAVPDVGQRVPLEIKGLIALPGEEDGAELAQSEMALERRFFAQLTLYLYLMGELFGAFVFKSKATGAWKVVPVALDLEHAEQLLQRAEHVRDAVVLHRLAVADTGWTAGVQDAPSGTVTDEQMARFASAVEVGEQVLPSRIHDRSECPTCPFRKHCRPSEAPVDPALLVVDAELIQAIERHQATKPGRDEYERLHKMLGERFKLTGGDVFFAGPWRIEKKKHGAGVRLVITSIMDGSESDAA